MVSVGKNSKICAGWKSTLGSWDQNSIGACECVGVGVGVDDTCVVGTLDSTRFVFVSGVFEGEVSIVFSVQDPKLHELSLVSDMDEYCDILYIIYIEWRFPVMKPIRVCQNQMCSIQLHI